MALPLAVLKPLYDDIDFNKIRGCMHGLTACGIETYIAFIMIYRYRVACMALPLAVLKHTYCPIFLLFTSRCCMHGLTACGIETLRFQAYHGRFLFVACMALPLAVLKLVHYRENLSRLVGCMHGLTACGIETEMGKNL